MTSTPNNRQKRSIFENIHDLMSSTSIPPPPQPPSSTPSAHTIATQQLMAMGTPFAAAFMQQAYFLASRGTNAMTMAQQQLLFMAQAQQQQQQQLMMHQWMARQQLEARIGEEKLTKIEVVKDIESKPVVQKKVLKRRPSSSHNARETILVDASDKCRVQLGLPPSLLAITPPSSADTSLVNAETSANETKSEKVDGAPNNRFTCEDCRRSYSTFSGLMKHRQFHCITQIARIYSCKHCAKEYSSQGALKMHIRTHTLPCKCHLCGKAFSRPWLLQGHLRTHTGEKPFRCEHCYRAFADRSNLRAHLQTHSQVKKYSCTSCNRTFSRMSLLIKHENNPTNTCVREAHRDDGGHD